MKSAVSRLLSSDKAFLPALCLALFVPLFVHGRHLGVPRVTGGDEPHYLVMLNSLLSDGDLDLRNNYASVWRGSTQAGRALAGHALDPHVAWTVGGHQMSWGEVYEPPERWTHDADGHPSPVAKPGGLPDVATLPQYSRHPAGVVFLLFPLLWPLRGTSLVEPAAVLCADLALLAAALLFRRVVRRYTDDPLAVNVATVATFLGTPLWAYGRTFFNEPFLTLFVVGAFAAALEGRAGWWSGLLLGLGMLMKPMFGLLLPPLLWLFVCRKRWASAVGATAFPLVATALVLYLDARWYGSPWISPQPLRIGNPLVGAGGLLFSWNHGLLAFTPLLLLAPGAWRRFLGAHRLEAGVLVGGFALYFAFFALWQIWWGGWCYGPRLITPVIPLLMVPFCRLPARFLSSGRFFRGLVCCALLMSLGINAAGALGAAWNSHPLALLGGARHVP